MSPANEDHAFDRRMRALHGAALDHVSPSTRTRLRLGRDAATRTGATAKRVGGWRWAAAGLASAVFAVALGLQFLPADAPRETPTPLADATLYESDYPGSLAALDENPDLYMWLASDAEPLAME
jgi:anti-sigma-K factor RskA